MTTTSARKRLRIWEVPGAWLCSVVGTCLTPADVTRVIRRCRLQIEDGAPEYQVHGFMVTEASRPGPVGREINRALDERATGALRKVGAEADPVRLADLWEDFCARGLVAPAYWAIMSHSHVPEDLKVRAFGDVHMLSHFMGGFNRANAKQLWLMSRQAQELKEKLVKARRQADAAIEARDARIATLEAELQDTRVALASACERRVATFRRPNPASVQKGRIERRLAAARARSHALEVENARLRGLLDLVTDLTAPPHEIVSSASPAPPRVDAGTHMGGTCAGLHCVLYVGGRCQLIPHLRASAEACNACLLHHDGGDKEPLHALGSLVERADVVVCPVDCVSHQGCLRAKSLCRRKAKPFIPLRSSSTTSFVRAIAALRRASGAG